MSLTFSMLKPLACTMCRHQLRALHSVGGTGKRRVVVTGMGLVCPLGVGVEHAWQKLIDGKSGVQRLTSKDYEKIPCKVAACVPVGDGPGELVLDTHIPKSERRGMSLATCYALIATKEALEQAKWNPTSEEERCSTGVAVGTGMVDLDMVVSTGRLLSDRGYNKVSPLFIPYILVNMPAGHISLRHGFKGVNHAVSTACATGVHAIGDASRFIAYGDVDVMVCGAAEASVTPLSIAGFARMRALSTSFNDNPEAASRPFDVKREGFVMGEGAGILILEELNHAKQRGANILAEVLGYGVSADSNHITAPCPDGDGAYRAMAAALKHSGVAPEEVQYINAHATSTPLGDEAESRAITRLFSLNHHKMAVSSTKSAIGHLLGAAGCVEAAFTAMACRTSVVPPTLNCEQPDDEFDLNYVPFTSQKWPDIASGSRRIALKNSFGFGGTNASLCIASYHDK